MPYHPELVRLLTNSVVSNLEAINDSFCFAFEAEMYMFNRSAESQNISQFIKGGIVEEEDQQDENDNSEALEMSSSSNLKSASELNAQNDEMFQMDKGFNQ